MAIFTSYESKGNKLSFANWISNLSPVDTFFVSTTKKEQIKNKKFQWQTDSLVKATINNAQKEGDDVVIAARTSTTEHFNVTQILRKAVEVSDTADVLQNYGRGSELGYQMEKAGKEIKRDLEVILLSAQELADGSHTMGTPPAADTSVARKTKCFQALVGKGVGKVDADDDTGAVPYFDTTTGGGDLTEEALFKATYNLYLAGSSANVIMYHPSYATFFSSLMENGAARTKLIENMETKLNKFVGSLIDPLGQEFKLVPNRFMPDEYIYIFNPQDWTQMVLRAPEKVHLAKTGSTEQYMIEMEVGLRHRHPYASSVLKVKKINP